MYKTEANYFGQKYGVFDYFQLFWTFCKDFFSKVEIFSVSYNVLKGKANW
jgi:hypothetical protein